MPWPVSTRCSCSPCASHAALNAAYRAVASDEASIIARTNAHDSTLSVRTVSVRPW